MNLTLELHINQMFEVCLSIFLVEFVLSNLLNKKLYRKRSITRPEVAFSQPEVVIYLTQMMILKLSENEHLSTGSKDC